MIIRNHSSVEDSFYKTLELDKNAHPTVEEVKNAYHRLALKWHPDKNPDNRFLANEKFIAIKEAFSQLMEIYTKNPPSPPPPPPKFSRYFKKPCATLQIADIGDNAEIRDYDWNLPNIFLVNSLRKIEEKPIKEAAIVIVFCIDLFRFGDHSFLLKPFAQHPLYPLNYSAFQPLPENSFAKYKNCDDKPIVMISGTENMLTFLQLLRCEKPDIFKSKSNRQNQFAELESALCQFSPEHTTPLFSSLISRVANQLIRAAYEIIDRGLSDLNQSTFVFDKQKKEAALKALKSKIEQLTPSSFQLHVKTFNRLSKVENSELIAPYIAKLCELDNQLLTRLQTEKDGYIEPIQDQSARLAR